MNTPMVLGRSCIVSVQGWGGGKHKYLFKMERFSWSTWLMSYLRYCWTFNEHFSLCIANPCFFPIMEYIPSYTLLLQTFSKHMVLCYCWIIYHRKCDLVFYCNGSVLPTHKWLNVGKTFVTVCFPWRRCILKMIAYSIYLSNISYSSNSVQCACCTRITYFGDCRSHEQSRITAGVEQIQRQSQQYMLCSLHRVRWANMV